MRDLIQRFPVRPTEAGEIVLRLPRNSKFIDVQFALVESDLVGLDGARRSEMLPCFWFETDSHPLAGLERRYIVAVGTGQKNSSLEQMTHLKTVQYVYPDPQHRGALITLVFHFYERPPKCTCGYEELEEKLYHSPLCEIEDGPHE